MGLGRNWEKSQELVVHFGEWTTGCAGNWGKGQNLGVLLGASGPLFRVDHWLGRKLGKRAENVSFARNQAGLKIILFYNRQVVSK